MTLLKLFHLLTCFFYFFCRCLNYVRFIDSNAVLSGLSLRSEELSKAFRRIKFNLFVQCFSFLVTSSIVYGIAQLLVSVEVVSKGMETAFRNNFKVAQTIFSQHC